MQRASTVKIPIPLVFQQAARIAARLVLSSVLFGLSSHAAEIVTLSSGAQMAVDWHESVGDLVRLHQGSGSTDVPARMIAGYEIRTVEEVPQVAENLSVAPQPTTEIVAVSIPSTTSVTNPREMLRDAAIRSGLPPEFVASVAMVESGFRIDALSPKGAIGVMQLMPDTAKLLGADPHDVQQNIDAGTRLLRDLLVKYDGDVVKTLAAYNAGEAAVEKYRGLPPYDETRFYVNRVIVAYQKAGGR
ncbi:MAG: lytic transglycosylase domain-containing protein [Acidobacteriota bacterium]